ncbi:MAG: hypothetical protein M1482_12725 [Chloroflexi bacterium]|nr:hypothetical protein [Chloroflexota bacterium]
MAVTLVDYFKQAKDPISQGFIADLLRFSDLFKVCKFDNVDGLQVGGTRWQTVPTAAFRKIGEGYTEGTGTTENIVETLSILGGDVKVDRVLSQAKNTYEDPLITQMQMKAKAVAFAFNDAFVNGDQGTDPDTFEGIKKRVSNMPARMSVDCYNTVDAGDGLPILKGAAEENFFVDVLHQAIKYVDGATHIFCNETVWLGLGRVLRRLGLLDTTTDAYGKQWASFAGVPFVDVGLRSDKSTEIISNTENPGDGGADCTSLYVARMDMDDGLHGIQLAGKSPKPYDPLNGNEMEGGPQLLRRIDWPVGLFNLSQYCICRVKGFRVAAA